MSKSLPYDHSDQALLLYQPSIQLNLPDSQVLCLAKMVDRQLSQLEAGTRLNLFKTHESGKQPRISHLSHDRVHSAFSWEVET